MVTSVYEEIDEEEVERVILRRSKESKKMCWEVQELSFFLGETREEI